MKNTIFVFALLILAAACTKEGESRQETAVADIAISINAGDGISGKALYVDMEACEAQVNDVQIFVFDQNGMLNAYKSAKSLEGLSVTTTYGLKEVWAVVNGPDLRSVTTLDGLKTSTVDLSANDTAQGRGFVMSGSAEVNVGKGIKPVEIDVYRLTARVAVGSISNLLPPAYTSVIIKSIVLANVVGNQNIAGTEEIRTWFNKAGRMDGGDEDSIIDGVEFTASCPSLTFHKPEESIPNRGKSEKKYCFYSYPNTTDLDAAGWTVPFTARKTRVIVTAEIGGEKYYYPVALGLLERNKAYTVNLTITSLGAKDPESKLDKDAFSAIVDVQPWDRGIEYTEII